jgi:hypothetical protein
MIPATTLDDLLAGLNAVQALLVTNPVSCKVGLITAPFTPSVDLLMGDLTIGALPGLTPMNGVTGSQNESVDPDSGSPLVDVKPPAGGFRWETQEGFEGPVSIYGFALGNRAFNVLYGTQLLHDPIVLTSVNEAITAPRLIIPTSLVPTREFLTQVRIHEAWMPTVWGWVEEEPPAGPPPNLVFDLMGDGTGNATVLAIPGPPTNAQVDIDLALAILGDITTVFPAPDCAPLANGEEFDGLLVEWSVPNNRYEYFLFPR